MPGENPISDKKKILILVPPAPMKPVERVLITLSHYLKYPLTKALGIIVNE